MYEVKFQLTDKCNIRCENCHWFSQPVNDSDKIAGYMDYLNWINKNKNEIKFITLTGGEPTLYPDFLKLINNIPETIKVRVYSNGTNIDILKQIARKNLDIVISKNRRVDADFEENIKKLNIPYQINSFNQMNANLEDELKFGENKNIFYLIGKSCSCKSKNIRFASDGYSYNCEIGARSKNIIYQTGLSLWNGEVKEFELKCVIKKECLSNFLNENKYKLTGRYFPDYVRMKIMLRGIIHYLTKTRQLKLSRLKQKLF
jgi:organic radical activating enzyme